MAKPFGSGEKLQNDIVAFIGAQMDKTSFISKHGLPMANLVEKVLKPRADKVFMIDDEEKRLAAGKEFGRRLALLCAAFDE